MLSPRLVQSLEILEMPLAELKERAAEEMKNLPWLRLVEIPESNDYFTSDKGFSDVDLKVDEDANGVVSLKINDCLRGLKVGRTLAEKLISDSNTDEEKEFYKARFRASQWFVEAVQQRDRTVLRVAKKVFELQPDILSDISEAKLHLSNDQLTNGLGISNATLNRAVRNKKIVAAAEVIEFSDLFPSNHVSAVSKEYQERLLTELRRLIDQEDKSKPLSDNQICIALNANGIPVGRRTITKMRQKLNIPSSRQRRNWQ